MSFIVVLGAVIFILCAVGICLLIRQPGQSNTRQNRPKSAPKQTVRKSKPQANRYQKKSPSKLEPRLGSSPFQMPKHEGADAVLGLCNGHDMPKDEPIKPKQFRIDSIMGERRLIVFYLRAEQGKPYAGYELLQTILSTGLRFGDMNIFHHADGFSLSSMTAPGTFVLDQMGSFSCTGLSLFLALENSDDPMKGFQSMLNVADQLVKALSGDVLDEGQALLSKDKVLELHQELQSAYV
jgi:FtsZ-interacting cell division protein ZipA